LVACSIAAHRACREKTVAEIIQGTITFGTPAAGRWPITLVVEIRFRQREIDEALSYGVNVALLKYDPAVQILTRHKGIQAMSLVSIPINANLALPTLGRRSRIIRPTDTMVRKIQFDFTMSLTAVPAGTQIHAVMTVVPEICETENFATAATVPAAPTSSKSRKAGEAAPLNPVRTQARVRK
jgi:hypothetical protein